MSRIVQHSIEMLVGPVPMQRFRKCLIENLKEEKTKMNSLKAKRADIQSGKVWMSLARRKLIRPADGCIHFFVICQRTASVCLWMKQDERVTVAKSFEMLNKAETNERNLVTANKRRRASWRMERMTKRIEPKRDKRIGCLLRCKEKSDAAGPGPGQAISSRSRAERYEAKRTMQIGLVVRWRPKSRRKKNRPPPSVDGFRFGRHRDAKHAISRTDSFRLFVDFRLRTGVAERANRKKKGDYQKWSTKKKKKKKTV